jgi:hypothetical protein
MNWGFGVCGMIRFSFQKRGRDEPGVFQIGLDFGLW